MTLRRAAERRVLTVTLHGRESSGGLVDADELGEFLIATVRRLKSIESDLGHGNRASYRIRKLRTSSPTISIEIATPPAYKVPASRIARTFKSGIEFIGGHGRAPTGLLPETVFDLGQLTLEHYRSIGLAEFRTAGTPPVKVPEKINRGLRQEFLRTAAIEGRVSGFVEGVNVHDQSVMYLYPVMLPVRIACHFPVALLDTVRSSVKRYTTVLGLQSYAEPSPYPTRVDVEAIEIHPPASDLPTLSSLIGTATQPHGRKSTKQYLAILERE